ncbi:MAG: type III-A CRISPR-associated protein Cas10/Csm1, partial [Candidatus Marinimicrobia bacterium]|nr:type III-A CRISPR-associated protein Cas10/Csm1 [Candidatus Neomarinimicrobiota bacterium]
NFRKQRLKPVFESLYNQDYHNNKTDKSVFRYILNPLALDEKCIFPQDIAGEDVSLDREYRENLWQEFEKEIQLLPNSDFTCFIESLLPLLQKYTWCIPSSTIDLPDISLYDHLRSTAAVALCYYDFLKEKYPDDLNNNNRSIVRKVFDSQDRADALATLICGDISGIQDFIYQIASHQAAKSLKGRSFMIQLLCDACARYFLKELDLPVTNLIYSSGGNFYILAPNTEQVQQKIKSIRLKINQSLLNTYGGNLYLGVGKSFLTARDFLHCLGEKWQEAIHAASRNKSERFIEEMSANADFFQAFGPVKDARVCSICGKDCPEDQLIKDKDGDETKSICPHCNELIELGSRLKKSQYLAEIHSADGKFQPLPGIPLSYEVFESDNVLHQIGRFQDVHVRLFRFNNTDFLFSEIRSSRTLAFSFKFYGGNHVPLLSDGVAATFNDLSGESGEGLKRLGVLRMDIDNLGLLFQRGFDYPSVHTNEPHREGLYSLSRLSTLSSMLDLFFSGYLNQISLNPDYEDKLYIIYSGGDDIFMVGKWNHVVDCAVDIRQQFRKFCCEHPDITLSGGMALVEQKYPIHRAADMAGEAEHRAKEYRIPKSDGSIHEKDAFTFLDKTLSWHDFMITEKMKEDLHVVVGDGDSKNKGLLIRLRRIYENFQKEKSILEKNESLSPEKRAELVQYNKWRWRMVYDLNRYKKSNEKHQEIIDDFQDALLNGNKYKDDLTLEKIPEFIDVPTRWTELLTR